MARLNFKAATFSHALLRQNIFVRILSRGISTAASQFLLHLVSYSYLS